MPTGRVTVAGIAWAQHTGIDRVEVRVDDGPWQPAELATEVNSDTWRMWRIDVEVAAGRATPCRAGPPTGPAATQTEARADVIPDGATGWPELPSPSTVRLTGIGLRRAGVPARPPVRAPPGPP